MMVAGRDFGIRRSAVAAVLCAISVLTSEYSCVADLANTEQLSGFGFELLISKMELLEEKVIDLEATVTDLRKSQTGMAAELALLRQSCASVKCSGNLESVSADTVEGYKSCSDSPAKTPGLIQLRPPGGSSFDVLCDFHNHGGGWTMIQHRFSGEVDFYRNWEEYKQGFGDLKGEFWLGLDKIHRITNSGNFELLFVLTDLDLQLLYARYSLFRIGNEADGYAITHLGDYNGTAGDSFRYHSGMKFTTWDRDNDLFPGSNNNCAVQFHGAWWYNNCQNSNLNGRYHWNEDGDSTCWNTHNPPKYRWCQGFNSITIMLRETK